MSTIYCGVGQGCFLNTKPNNRACHPSGHCLDYYPVALSLSQVTATHIKLANFIFGQILRMYYSDVIMSAMASQITRVSIDGLLNRLFRRRSKKHQSSASLAFVMGIHWCPLNSPHKGPVTRKMFPFDDVIMEWLLGPVAILFAC